MFGFSLPGDKCPEVVDALGCEGYLCWAFLKSYDTRRRRWGVSTVEVFPFLSILSLPRCRLGAFFVGFREAQSGRIGVSLTLLALEKPWHLFPL